MCSLRDAHRSRLIAARGSAAAVATLAIACGSRDATPAGPPSPAPGTVQTEPATGVDASAAAPIAAVDATATTAAPASTPPDPAAIAEQLGREGAPVEVLITDQVPADWSGDVLRTIRPHTREVRACYTRRLADKPRLAGKVTAAFEVGPDGAVTSASATGMDTQVAACIADVIRGLRFPPPAAGTAKATFPFVFTPAP